MQHIVTQEWLFEHGTDENVVIVDCRFVLGMGNADAGRKSYEQDHIPGAVYVDLEKELSAPITEHGGRHPLPDWDRFAEVAGAAGIGKDSKVIAYDDQGGAMASRFWWMLQYAGHTQAFVLDGGYAKWKAAGYPVTDEPPAVHAAVFVPKLQSSMVVSMEEVKERIGRPGTV
ncbi:sulfurtransferase [Paenibacillus sp. UNC451MF]|uniref:sulfurtransferase n=1 Tax=Paenibacillus sp. UNC451MF TaxID=1449063 RepID=UPI000B318205